jgi:hypothetical protein
MQKQLLLACGIFFMAYAATAQNCATPQASIDLHANHIKARVGNGFLFNDGLNGVLLPYGEQENGPSTMFTAGLWIGGVDAGNNVKVSASSYYDFNGPYSFFTGPYIGPTVEETQCADWDRYFRVTKQRIVDFLAVRSTLTIDQAIEQFPEIMGWPGKGNPHFNTVQPFQLPNAAQSLAPFFDENNDDSYNPMDGDYPVVALRNTPIFVPTEIIWSVFRTTGGATPFSPMKMEVQQTMWAFDEPSNPTLQNTIFMSQNFIHRGFEVVDSVAIGYFMDFDIGCFADDYVGTMPDRNAVFAYNADVVDGVVGGNCQVPVFEDSLPVQSVVFLNRSLDRSMYLNSPSFASGPTTDPVNASEYLGYLHGYWRDDTRLTYGGNGYGGTEVTNHVFPSDPSDANGWSECSSTTTPSDRRMVASHIFGQLAPGESKELNTAWITTFGADLPCGLGSTGADIDEIQAIYDSGFEGLGQLSSAPQANALVMFNVTPNPASDAIVLRYAQLNVLTINLIDTNGKLVRSVQSPQADAYTLSVNDLATGVYYVQILTNKGVGVQKVVVAR